MAFDNSGNDGRSVTPVNNRKRGLYLDIVEVSSKLQKTGTVDEV